MLRKVLAIAAGFLAVFVLVGFADFLYMRADPTAFTKAGAPIGTPAVLITTFYLAIINIIGGT